MNVYFFVLPTNKACTQKTSHGLLCWSCDQDSPVNLFDNAWLKLLDKKPTTEVIDVVTKCKGAKVRLFYLSHRSFLRHVYSI